MSSIRTASPLVKACRNARRRLARARLADAGLIAGWIAVAIAIVARGFLPMQRAVFVVVGAAVVSVVVAAFAVVRRWPTLADAAQWIDRTHGLNDLISTALLTPAADGFAAVVHRQADAAAAALPAPAWPGRFGIRAHAATLLGTAAAVIFIAMVPHAGPRNDLAQIAPADGDVTVERAASRDLTIHTPDQPLRPAEATSDLGSQAAETRSTPAAGDHRGDTAGGGAGRADAAAVQAQRDRERSASSNKSNDGRFPQAATGDGQAADATVGNGSAGGRVQPGSDRERAPWTMADWPEQREAARLATARLPDQYRAVVRAYFEK